MQEILGKWSRMLDSLMAQESFDAPAAEKITSEGLRSILDSVASHLLDVSTEEDIERIFSLSQIDKLIESACLGFQQSLIPWIAENEVRILIESVRINLTARCLYWKSEALGRLLAGRNIITNENAVITLKPSSLTGVRFPNRAAWLTDRLKERGWDHNEPYRHGGPDRKIVQKIQAGELVRPDTLRKLLHSLNQRKIEGRTILAADIPND
jgi:hypothetical protein